MRSAAATSSSRAISRRPCAAANAIGDDHIQKRTQGYAVPDSFTHGSAEQRRRWFGIGLQQGKFQSCDTFSAGRL
jgi:predicted metalloprotease